MQAVEQAQLHLRCHPGMHAGTRGRPSSLSLSHRERPLLSNTTSARSMSPQAMKASLSCCHVQSQGKLWTTTCMSSQSEEQIGVMAQAK